MQSMTITQANEMNARSTTATPARTVKTSKDPKPAKSLASQVKAGKSAGQLQPATPVKSTKSTAPAGPKTREKKLLVAQYLTDLVAGLVVKFPESGRKIDGVLITHAEFRETARQTFGYVSHDIMWPAAFGLRDVGRPGASKVPDGSTDGHGHALKPAKTTARVVKVAPAKSSVTPATVAKNAPAKTTAPATSASQPATPATPPATPASLAKSA